ncbi:aromatic motif membrane protein [Mycoplasma putrefaciens]|uniref:Lipoprotein n=1 Tax=Mycoplasma putrefaciens (strain ATCC 15718 / NCTC 10155 / C30 KS-1 / KS-1) TaxID=743965 RepID=A0A7U3ZSD5_MYCPK|nr:aromatic motif membrane protein [Mycoplasma putrefaciens]AEM68628.1 lipoprotein [Mycoplasma putrefaciens KS1]
MKNKIKYLLSSLMLVFVTSSVVSCKTSSNQIVINKIKDQHQHKWDVFLSQSYVVELLDLVFQNQEQKTKYIASQKKLDKDYFDQLREYFTYANNVVRSYSYDSKQPFGYQEFSKKLDQLFQENWLWALFNIDKFKFVLYGESEQFIKQVEEANRDSQKSSVLVGSFIKLKTNLINQYVIYQTSKNETYLYLLTSSNNIFKITIDKTNSKTKVELDQYTYAYETFLAKPEQIKNFDFKKYAHVTSLHNSSNATQKNLFDAQYGGLPLRLTVVDIIKK